MNPPPLCVRLLNRHKPLLLERSSAVQRSNDLGRNHPGQHSVPTYLRGTVKKAILRRGWVVGPSTRCTSIGVNHPRATLNHHSAGPRCVALRRTARHFRPSVRKSGMMLISRRSAVGRRERKPSGRGGGRRLGLLPINCWGEQNMKISKEHQRKRMKQKEKRQK